MADESEAEKQSRLQLEEFQRQQAAAAVAASRSKPNAIPAEAQPRRAVDYAQPTGEYIVGSQTGSSVGALNRPPQEWGGPSAFTTSGQPSTRVPSGTNVVQGAPLSSDEENFWRANPLGAVMDGETGALVGLGNNEGARQQALQRAGVSGQTGGTFGAEPQRAPTIDDFIDPVIEARRGEIANERAVIMGHLNTASTQRTGGGRHGGGGPSQWETEYAKLKALDHADSVLQKEQFGRAHLKAQMAGEQFKQQRQMDTANQTQGFYSAMANVRSPIGTPEHAQEVLAIAGQFPLAMNTPEIKKVLQEHADLHDSHAQLIANAQAQGKIVTQTGISASGKPTYRVTDPNVVPTSVEQRYNRLQASIQQHLEQSDIEKQTNVKAGRAGVAYSKAPALNADVMEADAIAAKYPSLMPKKTQTDTAQTGDLAAPPNPQERAVNTIYVTPKGRLRWTGTGWVNP